MNYENLKTLAETAYEHTVGGVPSLYCDGSLICISGGLTVKDGRFLERAIDYWGKALPEAFPPLLYVGPMRGKFPDDPYIRELIGEASSVVIQEKYVRCFDAGADRGDPHARNRTRPQAVGERFGPFQAGYS